MKPRTKRRFKRLNKKARIERRIHVQKNQKAYELAVLTTASGRQVEVWRSTTNGIWVRLGKVPLEGEPSRHDVIRSADKIMT